MRRSQRIARDVVRSLEANRSRALLMMLGVAVGVAALSAVIVIGQGTRQRILGLVARHGLDMIMVRAGGETQVFAPRADRGLTVLMAEDARAIAAEVPGVRQVSVVQNQRGLVAVYGDRSVTTRVFGVEPAWQEIRRWAHGEGEFISEADHAAMARVAILGLHVARELFPDGDAVGQTIRLQNDPYVVKGVFGEMGTNAGGDNWDDRIVVPFSTSSRRLFGRPYLEQIVVRVDDARQVPAVAERIREVLRVRHGIGPGQPDDFFVREPEDVEGAALEAPSTLNALLVVLAGVALLAGGLVIMNLMLLSVTQRTREIGLRRALGARRQDIARQFLFESLAVSLGGALLGLAVGLGIALGLSAGGLAQSRITLLPFVLAVAACVALGLGFGIHPARRAAAVDPVTALRGHLP
jgi:putative ABC transport system permease protein